MLKITVTRTVRALTGAALASSFLLSGAVAAGASSCEYTNVNGTFIGPCETPAAAPAPAPEPVTAPVVPDVSAAAEALGATAVTASQSAAPRAATVRKASTHKAAHRTVTHPRALHDVRTHVVKRHSAAKRRAVRHLGGAHHAVIRPGDTATKLARRYGLKVRTLARLNGWTNPNHIVAGRLVRF